MRTYAFGAQRYCFFAIYANIHDKYITFLQKICKIEKNIVPLRKYFCHYDPTRDTKH